MFQRVYIILMLCFPLEALAEEALLPEIEVRDATAFESSQDISAFTTVIAPKIHEKEMRTAVEILDAAVGMHATDLGGLGQLSTVSIRGSSSEQVIVLLDGVRINTAQRGGVDFASIPLDAIERIEVIRGGSSARFGSDAIGGVINIVTKRAKERASWDARMTQGSFATLKMSESLTLPFERAELIFAHQHLSSEGDYPFISAATNLAGTNVGGGRSFMREHNSTISEDLLTKGKFNFSKTVQLSLSNDLSWSDREIPGTEEETTLLAPANPLEAKNEIYRDTTAATLNITRVGTDALALELGASNFFMHDAFQDPSPAVGNPIDIRYLNESITGYSELTHLFAKNSVQLISTLRYQYRFDYLNDSSPLNNVQLFGNRYRHVNSLLIDEELGLLQERLLLLPAVRLEDTTDRTMRLSWKTGVVGKPTAYLDIKANVQASHRYPSFNELFFPDQGYVRGNPNLDDERSIGGDIGFVLHPKLLSLEAAYFQSKIDNSILFVPISATTLQPINTGEVDSYGTEVSLTLRPLPFLDLQANYTWLIAQFSSNSLRLPGRPEHKFNIRGDIRYKAISLYGEVQYVSNYPINTANSVFLTERLTANAGTTFRFSKNLFATFEVKDLTDVQMYDARGFPLPRRSFWLTLGARA